jgi:hypothetical protein
VAWLASRADCKLSHEDADIDILVQDRSSAESTETMFTTVDEGFAALNEFDSGANSRQESEV